MTTRGAGVALAAAVLALALATPAGAATLLTIETPSRFVDASRQKLIDPPPGVPRRHDVLRANVMLPDGYDGRRRFPVVYLLHGHGGGFYDWAKPEGNVMAIARGLPAIIVMPDGAEGWYSNWLTAARGGPQFERYYLEELVELVERRFRVVAGRRWHAMVGFSMGGQGAAFLAGQRPGYFGSVAVYHGSLSIQRPEWPAAFDTQGERYAEVYGDVNGAYAEGHNPVALAVNLAQSRVYVSTGDGIPNHPEDADNAGGAAAEAYLRNHSEDFAAAARRAAVPLTYEPRHGIHDWADRRQFLADAIRWNLFGPVPEAPSSWTYRTIARNGSVWGLGFVFAQPPPEVATFERRGGRLAGRGTGTVTIRSAGGCSFTAPLPFERAVPDPDCRLRLTVRPRRLRHGGPVRFLLRVSSPSPGCRAGVTIHFAGLRLVTDARGRAAVTRLLPRGLHRARASKAGCRRVTRRVRVLAPRR